MTAEERTSTTYRWERWRALSGGINESAGVLFLLLIAVRWYGAGPLAKALVAGGGSIGLLLSPWLVSRVEAAQLPVARAAARLSALGGFSFLLMAMVPTLPVFVAGSAIAMATASATIPLLTQIYQDNYPAGERGRLFARTMIIRIGTAALCCELGGRLLTSHIGLFRWLLLVFAAGCGAASYCLSRCPSNPLSASAGTHPFRALRFARDDRVFRQTLIAWMFIGFAMLMMSPLRVEYLANPKYGITVDGRMLTATTIALLTGVIPNLARLVLNPVWGWLFDHMNFFKLRLLLNLGFSLGILSFFTTGSMQGLVVGALLFGISNAGADVAWGLWVTKFAPPGRVADYMSVHTFFTGVRGVVAPLVAFSSVASLSPHTLGWISVGLITTGSAFLISEIALAPGSKPGHPPAVETSPDRE
jgi:hypothetical protein